MQAKGLTDANPAEPYAMHRRTSMPESRPEYERLAEALAEKGVDVGAVKAALKAQRIETPSWGYGDSGTRFKVFRAPGAARSIFEKISDAAFIHRLTGIAPSMAIHIPWDKTNDWQAVKQSAAEHGIAIGAVNPNLFQDDEYKFGSVCNSDAAIRQRAVDHCLECVEIMGITGSRDLSMWLADGTNYAGQDSIRERKHNMVDALSTVVKTMPASARMLVEYKFFEPGFYHTDLADWGMSAAVCRKLGPQARVLVDTGHHAPGTNTEHIVAFLLDEGMLGGFHFNNRKYADDDLIVGTVNPFELFLIYHELVNAALDADPLVSGCARDVAYMIDQSHNIEPKLEAMVQSVLNCQAAYAKALIVDRAALAERQAEHDVLGAYRVVTDAFETDVRPLLAEVRREMGIAEDPIAALKTSDYPAKVASERGAGGAGDSGYPGA
jgi:L-rhamnose isomerase/sugar isomerase